MSKHTETYSAVRLRGVVPNYTRTESRNLAAEMRVLRTIRGVTRTDRMRSTRIREHLHVIPLLKEIETNKLSWYGHVWGWMIRESRRNISNGDLRDRDQWVEPRKRWIEGVQGVLVIRGKSLRVVEEDEIYRNKEEWRTYLRDL